MPCIYYPLVCQSLNIWAQVWKNFGWHAGLFCARIVANRQFTPLLEDDSFLVWHEKGTVSFKDLYIADSFAPFDQLRAKFDLRFVQVRDWIRNQTRSYPAIPEQQPMDTFQQLHLTKA